MSTPPFLAPPPGTRSEVLVTGRGHFAAWLLDPPGPARGTGVLVPGFTGSKEDFVAVLDPLAADGWRVVAYDQRGQHESPAGAAETYDLAELATDLIELTKGLDQAEDLPVHLLGHSFGGLVVREAVLASPESFASLTLLCSGPSGVGGPTAEVAHLFAAALEALPIHQVWDAKVAYDASQGLHLPDDPELAGFLRARFVANDPQWLAAIARLLTTSPDRTDELAASDIATLVAYGETDDAWGPQEQRAMAERLGAECAVIAGAGHSPAAEAPEPTASLISEFWDRAQPSGYPGR